MHQLTLALHHSSAISSTRALFTIFWKFSKS
jgi:hypothetical protein